MPSPHQALTAFADTAQNPDLARLESLLKRFNLFEAVGVVRHELRHSDFLAFLIDPSRSHGLGSLFLRRFLQAVQLTAEAESALALLDLNALDFSQAYVLREWHHVDILMVDDLNRFAVILENKIGTSEHSDQLNRYHADFARHYPGYTPIALYLTPDGDEPSSEEYQAVSYTLVCEVIEKIAQNNRTTIDSEIVIVLEHYVQMLKRHVLSDTEVAELCRSIYQNHRQALDLIFEHRPDQQAQIGEYVKSLIEQANGIDPGTTSAKRWIIFVLNEWKASPRYASGSFYIYFEFHNLPEDLKIFCSISPGDGADRAKLFQMAQNNHFPGCSSRLNRGTCRLATLQILRLDDYEKTQDEIEAMISEKWAKFLSDDLPRMAQAIREEEWLWELP